jgi:hypothetical protein
MVTERKMMRRTTQVNCEKKWTAYEGEELNI